MPDTATLRTGTGAPIAWRRLPDRHKTVWMALRRIGAAQIDTLAAAEPGLWRHWALDTVADLRTAVRFLTGAGWVRATGDVYEAITPVGAEAA